MNSIMKIKNIFLPLLSAIILLAAACKQNDSNDLSTSITIDSIKKETIYIDTFLTSPEVSTCTCFFSTDSSAYHQQAYICAYDLSTVAFMKINGVMTKFNQTEFNGVGNGSVTKFKSEKYELMLETGDVKEINSAATLQSGSIRVTNTSGVTVIIPFYGQCGCKKTS
jgi:hypothetical protein